MIKSIMSAQVKCCHQTVFRGFWILELHIRDCGCFPLVFMLFFTMRSHQSFNIQITTYILFFSYFEASLDSNQAIGSQQTEPLTPSIFSVVFIMHKMQFCSFFHYWELNYTSHNVTHNFSPVSFFLFQFFP